VFDKPLNIYQNIYNKTYTAKTLHAAKQISLEVRGGDWLTLNTIEIKRGEGQDAIKLTPGITTWGIPQASYSVQKDGSVKAQALPSGFEEHFEPLGYLKPWKALKKRGGDVIVGEFGVYKSVPHATALAFMKQLLEELEQADIGWAVWDFNGDFGPFDSGRDDVEYENYEGYKLDREMLDLLAAH
jgi:hypothetical protein